MKNFDLVLKLSKFPNTQHTLAHFFCVSAHCAYQHTNPVKNSLICLLNQHWKILNHFQKELGKLDVGYYILPSNQELDDLMIQDQKISPDIAENLMKDTEIFG